MPDPLSLAENERRFLAQELHDGMTQSLLQVNMQASICKQYLLM
jgi:signal transduction histidine kinase